MARGREQHIWLNAKLYLKSDWILNTAVTAPEGVGFNINFLALSQSDGISCHHEERSEVAILFKGANRMRLPRSLRSLAMTYLPVIARNVVTKQSQCVAPRMRLPRSLRSFSITNEEFFLLCAPQSRHFGTSSNF